MRIAIPMPVTGPPTGAALPATVQTPLDRAALAQVASLAAGAPWRALDLLMAERSVAAPASPITNPGMTAPPAASMVLPPGTAAALGAVLNGSRGALPTLGTLPAATPAPVAAALAASPLPALALQAAGRDRLTLSPALALAATAEPAAASRGPVGDVLSRMLNALTGDRQGQLTVTAFGTAASAAPTAPSAPPARAPQDLLQLLVRGIAVGSDRQAVELTLGLQLLRQAPAAVIVDAGVLEAVRAALEQLASREIDLDLPGSAQALAGQSARFQAQFDPAALWPMQSFLLSGLLIFGRVRPVIDEAAVDESEDAGDPEADTEPREDADDREAEPPRSSASEAETPDLPTPLAADGGAPFISASRWLELELRHWRVQVQRWMALPVEAGS